jgi:hypothetical protein
MRLRAEGDSRSEAQMAAASEPIQPAEGQRQSLWVLRCRRTEARKATTHTDAREFGMLFPEPKTPGNWLGTAAVAKIPHGTGASCQSSSCVG